jgi:hypothetical protein
MGLHSTGKAPCLTDMPRIWFLEFTGIPEIVNIQNDNGKAKSYQVKQFLSLIEKYNLKLEDN